MGFMLKLASVRRMRKRRCPPDGRTDGLCFELGCGRGDQKVGGLVANRATTLFPGESTPREKISEEAAGSVMEWASEKA